jgi:energy-converting hydrogenase Eha subunit A
MRGVRCPASEVESVNDCPFISESESARHSWIPYPVNLTPLISNRGVGSLLITIGSSLIMAFDTAAVRQ